VGTCVEAFSVSFGGTVPSADLGENLNNKMSAGIKNVPLASKADHNSISTKQIVPQNENQENSFQDRSRDGKAIHTGDLQEQDLPEYIQMLEDHQAVCEREGRYVEAEMAKNKIIELRNHLEISKREELLQSHFLEKEALEQEHLQEFAQFNEFWDSKMAEFNDQARAIEEQMIQRHHEEMGQFLEELEMSITTKPKDSAEILNLRKIQQTLAKQKDYIEAHKIQQQCMKLERQEVEKWQSVREQKIKNQKAQLEHKQANELNAIRKRIVTGQEEQRKARSLDLEKLLHKYQNIRKEVMQRQQAELNQISRPAKGSTYGSVFRSQSSKMNITNSSIYKGTSRQTGTASSKRIPLQEASNVNRTNQKTNFGKKKY